MNPFITDIRAKAAANPVRAALPDAEDVRVLQAAVILRDQRLAQPVLVGAEANIRKLAADQHVDLAGVEILDPATSTWHGEFAGALYEKRKAKGMTLEQAGALVRNPLYFAGHSARHRSRARDGRREHLLDRRCHPGGHLHRRGRARDFHRQQLLRDGAPGRPAPVLRRLRGEPRPERQSAGRHRHHLGPELPGGHRPRAAGGHAFVLDQGQRRPSARGQGAERGAARARAGAGPDG